MARKRALARFVVAMTVMLVVAACGANNNKANNKAPTAAASATRPAAAATAATQAAATAAATRPATPAAQQATKEPITLGIMYDATGATQNIGVPLKAGVEDYFNLINSKGGIDGHPINAIYCDDGYQAPKGVECYENQKRAGAIGMLTYGTPIVAELLNRCNQDQIPCLFPGYGAAGAANGEKYPYGFPMAASYWSQIGAAVRFILDQWQQEGKSGKPKLVYLYYDNPAGNEPISVLDAIAQKDGLQVEKIACPAPCNEMSAQVTRITGSIRPDWIITHLFGAGPSVSIKSLKGAGFPLNHVISLVWGSGDTDVDAAGGWSVAQGYYGLQFTAVGTDVPVLRDIQQMYRDQGKQPPDAMTKNNVYYLRGVAIAAVFTQGLANALKQKSTALTGADLKAGLEAIHGDVAGVANLNVTARDHEGAGLVRVYQVKGNGWQLARDWFQGYRDIVESFVYKP
jgi:branched-chain amino acid transport system substrate-binding protein